MVVNTAAQIVILKDPKGDKMAKRMLLILKVLPDGTDVDLESLKIDIEKGIPPRFELQKNTFSEAPLAFGLKALKFRCFAPNEDGISDIIESALGKIAGVQRAEVELQSLTEL